MNQLTKKQIKKDLIKSGFPEDKVDLYIEEREKYQYGRCECGKPLDKNKKCIGCGYISYHCDCKYGKNDVLVINDSK